MILSKVQVYPKTKRNELIELSDGSFKFYTTASATNGKANEATIKAIAEFMKVPPSLISIKSGATSRHKILEIIQ